MPKLLSFLLKKLSVCPDQTGISTALSDCVLCVYCKTNLVFLSVNINGYFRASNNHTVQ